MPFYTLEEAEDCGTTPAEYRAEKRRYEAARARVARTLLKGVRLSKAQTAKIVDGFEEILQDKYGCCLE